DHARALALILGEGRPGEKYNVGGRNERANLDVVEAICDLVDDLLPTDRSRRELITFVADRPGHDRRYAIDPRQVEAELGWVPSRSSACGGARRVRWYLDNRWWWEPLRAGVYGGERLGLADA